MVVSAVPTAADPEVLDRWAAAVESEIAEITAAITPLQRQLEEARERLDLIRRLARLSDSTRRPSNEGSSPASLATSSGDPIEGRIEALLRTHGESMHIGEIRNHLIEEGVPLPGKGDEANIILRLRRADERFVRTGRGMYGLTEWNVAAVPPKSRRRRVERRRGAK